MKLFIDKDLNFKNDKIKLTSDFILFCADHLKIENDFKVYVVAQREPHGITTTAVYEVNNNCCKI